MQEIHCYHTLKNEDLKLMLKKTCLLESIYRNLKGRKIEYVLDKDVQYSVWILLTNRELPLIH